MTTTVSVKPELIRWAIERSGLTIDELGAIPVKKWLSGQKRPTLIQLENFAKRTFTPSGYLFLLSPPDEKLPVQDFRTVGDSPIKRPSPNLIETLQVMQRRQNWMRDFLIEQGQPKLPFIASIKRPYNIGTLVSQIRKTLGLTDDWASKQTSWENALRVLRNVLEDAGILVASSSVVGLNNFRSLDPQEFRGFVLCDEYAPIIFVNSADSKSAQMFTVVHELAHLWLGYGGLFNLVNMEPSNDEREKYCNQVAAEFLVPKKRLVEYWPVVKDTTAPIFSIAKYFKVSPLVAARRLLDLQLISKAMFFVFYNQQQEEWKKQKIESKSIKKGGPDFYKVQDVRLGRRFAYAVVRAAQEGRLLYRDAYLLTDLYGKTFDRYANILTKRMRDG